jgi:hypothetical protein
MIWSILKKDWTLLWPLVVLVTLIQVAFEWALYKFGFFGSSSLAGELMRLLSPAWNIGIVAVAVAAVHEDPVPGVDQDWLVRPLLRGDLLAAKLLFVLLGVCLPMLIVNVVHELALGFPAVPSIGDAIYKEIFIFLGQLVPVMALAAVTRNMRDLIVLVAGLVVLYVASVWIAALLFGADRCPTCDTSISWIEHQLQHVGLFVGSAVVLGLQYFRRETRTSRVLLAIGVVLLVAVQLTWNMAWAIQTRMGAPIGTPAAAVQIVADATEVTEATRDQLRKKGARVSATRALLQGDVDTAVLSIEGNRQQKRAAVILDVPLRVSGLAHDDYLAVDHTELSLVDAQGKVLYSDEGGERKSKLLLPDDDSEPGIFHQTFEIPGSVYKRIGARAVKLVVDYSLTVRAVVAQHKMPALDGQIRSPEVGVCQTHGKPDIAHVRCKQIGHASNCYAAILYGPDGQHNPEVQACGSDYRPFIPIPSAIVSFTGIDLPIRDNYGVPHYAVDGSDLQHSSIVLKVYEPGQHFRRTITSPLQPLAAD